MGSARKIGKKALCLTVCAAAVAFAGSGIPLASGEADLPGTAALSVGAPSDTGSSSVTAAAAPTPGEKPGSTTADAQAAIDKIAKKYHAVGVQVAVIENGTVTRTYEYGYAKKKSSPMTPDTKIRVASISKVILAMTIMRLSDQGLLDIDADTGDYWGGAVRNPNYKGIPITIRSMLSHTSSIRSLEYGYAVSGDIIRSRLLNGSCFTSRKPGLISSHYYNNYVFAVLGVLAEFATGETINDIAKRELFSPLGIDAAFGAGYITDKDLVATIYNSSGYVGQSADSLKKAKGSTFPGETGCQYPGGLIISASDLAKLIAALANDGVYNDVRILSAESVALMESSQGHTNGYDQCLPMRLRVNIYGQDELYYHTGSAYGELTTAAYNPVTKNGVVVLTTGAGGGRDSNYIPVVCAEIIKYVFGIID